MRRTPPAIAPEYEGNTRKTFRSALCHLLQTEFPGVFGPAVTQLFAERVEQLFDKFHPERSRLKVGQVVWAAVAADDPPARDKRIEQTRLVPVVLDLVAPEDIEQMVGGARIAAIRRSRLRRLLPHPRLPRRRRQRRPRFAPACPKLRNRRRDGQPTRSRAPCDYRR